MTCPDSYRRGETPGLAARMRAMSGYVGILAVELHFPEAGSLKGKRRYVKSAKAQLQHRFGASVAEVDHHELWQRARLVVACVARGHRELGELLDGAERWLGGQEWELIGAEREVVAVE
jgi:uncharacterized protein